MTRKQAPKPHPDWVWLCSGGIDSTAAYLLTKDALHDNYQKRPLMAYLDTRVGLPLQRMYVEELADRYREQLWALRTHEHFEDRVAGRGKFADRDDSGAPGGALHGDVQRELKGRQRETLARRLPNAIYVTGIRADESDARAAKPKYEATDPCRYVKPVYSLTKKECAEIILRHEDCPINPTWVWPEVIADCGCLSNGDPSELDATEERFPWFAQRLREYEESADADGLRGTLGWDGLTADQKAARRDGLEQMTLCSEACGRRRDPAIVRAFRARIHGATVEESVGILHEQSAGVEVLTT